jgi:hypothetical protein
LVGNPEGKKLHGRLGIDAMTILKPILRNRTGRRGMDYPASKQWPVAGLCEHGNEIYCAIKCGSFLQ